MTEKLWRFVQLGFATIGVLIVVGLFLGERTFGQDNSWSIAIVACASVAVQWILVVVRGRARAGADRSTQG